MATSRTTVETPSRLSYYRQRASRVKSVEVGDQAEARKESLQLFEELRPVRDRANHAPEHNDE